MPPNEALTVRIDNLERSMATMKMDLEGKTDRMEKRTISAMGEFSRKLENVENKVGRIMVFVAALGAMSGAGGLQLVKALIGG